MGAFERNEAWYLEPDDGYELPEGCWSEDEVESMKQAITDLFNEQVYEGGHKENGISVRFLARMSMLKFEAGMLLGNDPIVEDARRVLGIDLWGKSVSNAQPGLDAAKGGGE